MAAVSARLEVRSAPWPPRSSVRAAVAAYAREGRRPPLQPGGAAGGDPADAFELHFSKYSLESECANSSLVM